MGAVHFRPDDQQFSEIPYGTANFAFLCHRERRPGHSVCGRQRNLLAADRKNEPELKKSRWIRVIVILFEMFTVWMLVVGIQKIVFYYDIRLAFPVQTEHHQQDHVSD